MPLALVDITPPSGVSVGPLFVGFYGLGYVLALAVLLAVTQVEARRRGLAPGDVSGAIIIVAACALVGARLYHVIDEWAYYSRDPLLVVLPPYSGLGLYGGILGACVGIWLHARRRGVPLPRALDIVVPGTLLAQGIARWGNWFNQELYGPPTDLPWGITIDCAHRLEAHPCLLYPAQTTGFHPLFLYESMLDILGGLIALALSRAGGRRLRDGDVASFWMAWYGCVRIALEPFRTGYGWQAWGIPIASAISAILVAAGVVTFVRRHRRSAPMAPGANAAG